MNPGLEIADLRKIHILRHLTDDELGNIKSVHVYGGGRSAYEGLSALYITKTDEVFLAGYDSLVGGKISVEEVPDGCHGILKGSVKVPELTGKSVQKIVVGNEFGAALTSSNELYMWGCDVGPHTEIPAGLSRLVVEHNIHGARCPKCSRALSDLNFPYCSGCECCPNKVSTIPHPADWKGKTSICLGYAATDTQRQISTLFCINCGGNKQCRTTLVSNFYLMQCIDCTFLIRDGQCIPTRPSPTPHKVQTTLKIEDIAAGFNYLLMRTSSQLFICGELNVNRYNHAVPDLARVNITKVACGSAHIAVITDKGHLYTCGVGREGQLGYTWADGGGCIKLKKVELEEPVVDVACGVSSTICLLQNGKQVVYGNITQIVLSGSRSLELYDKALIVIPSAVYYSSGNTLNSLLTHHLKPHDKHLPVFTGDISDAFVLIHGLKLENTTSTVSESQTEPEHQQFSSSTKSDSTASLVHKTSNSARLYGQILFSDLTLTLADGNFPAHRSVLYTSSAYFSQLFADSDPPEVLDMSSYNASAYRGLLKYFYGVPLDPMTCEDLFDLYILATSYKEDRISADLVSKLKASIDADNVLLLHDKAKAANASDLLTECPNFMNTPEFKQWLVGSFTQNDYMIPELLRLYLSLKP